MIKAVPLEIKYLTQASNVANAIFPNEIVTPGETFEASLNEEKFKLLTKLDRDIKNLEYFVALDNKENVLGTSGLYSMRQDEEDSYWLGWFCVDQRYRGKGAGKLLLETAINEARNRGKKFLKLYTSTHPSEAKAQIIYEKYGFFLTDQKRIQKDGFETIFRKKVL